MQQEKARISDNQHKKRSHNKESFSKHSDDASLGNESFSTKRTDATKFVTSTDMYGSHIKKMISSAKLRTSFSSSTAEVPTSSSTSTSTSTSPFEVSSKQQSMVDERDISLAMRTLDALETVLAPRFITCAQMYVLLSHLPGGAKNVEISKHSTFRVELIVRLFTLLTDIIHFDFVIKVANTIMVLIIVHNSEH